MTPTDPNYSALLLCVVGMAVVTALPRILPITFLAGRKLPSALMRWLSFVPVSVLAALLTPEVLLRNGKPHLAPDNFFLLACLPTLLVAWRTRSFFGAVTAGMATVALLRLLC